MLQSRASSPVRQLSLLSNDTGTAATLSAPPPLPCPVTLPKSADSSGGPPTSEKCRPRRLAFGVFTLTERGTTLATYDYADLSETVLGIPNPLVLYSEHVPAKIAPFSPMVAKFKARFGANFRSVRSTAHADFDPILAAENITDWYVQKSGGPDANSFLSKLASVRNLVHVVFNADDRFRRGDVYARISSAVPADGSVPVVPYVVRPGIVAGTDMRSELDIPVNATVFGRHGGRDSFNIAAVREVVLRVAKARKDLVFLFMNTAPKPSLDETGLPNIIHLKATSDDELKSRFIRSCDAMLHARLAGETFGLAVAEFSVHNRPVLTWMPKIMNKHSRYATAHLRILGKLAQPFRSASELERQLTTFNRTASAVRDWNAYRSYAPLPVMSTFARVFLSG